MNKQQSETGQQDRKAEERQQDRQSQQSSREEPMENSGQQAGFGKGGNTGQPDLGNDDLPPGHTQHQE